jgi:hypothetical protein
VDKNKRKTIIEKIIAVLVDEKCTVADSNDILWAARKAIESTTVAGK